MKKLWSTKVLAMLGAGSLLCCDPTLAQGFRLEPQRITVTRARDWNEWRLGNFQEPVGDVRQDVVEITRGGVVRPRFIRKGIDALSNAPTFSHFIEGKVEEFYVNTFKDGRALFAWGGIKNAGSNLGQAANIIDRGEDRLETFWEPDLDRPPSEWWIEIDLGRVTSAEKVVLRFVDEELGDPFLQFRVLVSNGEFAFGNRETLEYRIIGGTTQAVEDELFFEYDLIPEAKADAQFTGAPIQYVRIVVTDSRKDRAAEMSQAVYESLLRAQRGAIDYFLKTFDGREILVTQADYERVAPERQAAVRYYRRERPRLADVQVFTVGDNLALGIRQRGGNIRVNGNEGHIPANAFDGDYRSYWKAQTFLEVGPGSERGGLMTVDLGTTFWMDSYRVIPNNLRTPILGYIARVSDGSRASDGSLVWEIVSPLEREINAEATRRFEDSFEPRLVRFFEFKHVDGSGLRSGRYGAQYEIGEIQFFGEGYVPEVLLTSPLIELNRSVSLTRLEWAGEIPPGTEIEIRTQTGNELIPSKKFFDDGGKEVTRDKYYNQLASFQRGDSTVTFVPGVDWSPLSNPYEESGGAFQSPTPRQFLKIQTRLLSTRPDAFAALDSLVIYFRSPIARLLVAEITPKFDVARVDPETFSLFLRSVFVDQPTTLRNPRFDEIRVLASQQTEMELLEVRVGAEDSLLAGKGEVFRSDDRGGFVNPVGEKLEVRPTGADSLWIKLPRLIDADPDMDPIYHRITQEGDEAPLNKRGGMLTRQDYSLLPEVEQGTIDYFRIQGTDAKGASILQKVEKSTYDNLSFQSQGPVRYNRVLFEGEEVSLDDEGNPVTRSAYNSLSSTRRGVVLREGQMVALRFRSRIFLNGTTFSAEVANSDIANSWQQVDPGDAVKGIDGAGTAVFVPIDNRILHSLEIVPSPFTPNGDGINDRLHVIVSVLKIDRPRQIQVEFFTLGGTRVAKLSTMGIGGRRVLEWDGHDEVGGLVPPGIYVVRVHVDTDSDSENTQMRVVNVVY